MYILSDTKARSKSNQAMKFNQYRTWEISFLKSYAQNVVEKPFPKPFLKNQNGASLNQQSEVSYILYFLFEILTICLFDYVSIYDVINFETS